MLFIESIVVTEFQNIEPLLNSKPLISNRLKITSLDSFINVNRKEAKFLAKAAKSTFCLCVYTLRELGDQSQEVILSGFLNSFS